MNNLKTISKSIFILFVAISFTLDIQCQENKIAEFVYEEVSPSVVLLHHQKPEGSNITCIALDAGLVFFDCSFFTERAVKFRKDMEEKFNRNTLALVLTHSHIDHFFGMAAFSDVPVIASYSSQQNFKRQLSINFPKYVEGYKNIFPKFDEALKEAKLFMPTIWYEKEIQLGSDSSLLIIKNTGGHSICSSYAFFEKEGVIVAGDNLQAEYYPYFGDPTGSVPMWIETLKEWETLSVNNVSPGHGPFVDKEYVTSTRVFFEEFYAALVDLKKANTPEEDVISYDGFPKGYWPEDKEKPGWYDPSIIHVYKTMKIDQE
jgi:glyoxylase-like metal-dependent hydrolase (beta-lactamase superfamily II)